MDVLQSWLGRRTLPRVVRQVPLSILSTTIAAYTPFELIDYCEDGLRHEIKMVVDAPIEKCFAIWSDRLNWLQWFDMIEEVWPGMAWVSDELRCRLAVAHVPNLCGSQAPSMIIHLHPLLTRLLARAGGLPRGRPRARIGLLHVPLGYVLGKDGESECV